MGWKGAICTCRSRRSFHHYQCEKPELEVSLETSENKARKKVWHQPGIGSGRSQLLVSRDKQTNMEVAR
jgi:hypothetical protein